MGAVFGVYALSVAAMIFQILNFVNQNLLYMQQAHLDCRKKDRYKRDICTVSTDAAGDVGLAMIRQGMAWWYRDYAREQSADARKRYEQAEQQAMKEKRGLWSDPHAMPPWEWRRERRKK